jgi:hypothetical protein
MNFCQLFFARHDYFSTHAPSRGDCASSFNEGSGREWRVHLGEDITVCFFILKIFLKEINFFSSN